MYCIYVLKSIRYDKLYIGSSREPERRLKEHNSGKTKSTKPYAPYELVYTESFTNKTLALKRERQIKKSGKIRQMLKEEMYNGPIV